MQLVFPDTPFPTQVTKSIFLAGPSPRREDVRDWRPLALEALKHLGFDGVVYIPIPSYRFNGAFRTEETAWSYADQCAWECDARSRADAIVFWVPRDIDLTQPDMGMPAFTTNFELGEDLTSGRVWYGRPPEAVKCRYLDNRCQEQGLEVFTSLTALLESVVQSLGEGAVREDGETRVPLVVWQTAAFQSWYQNVVNAGNRLVDATIKHLVLTPNRQLFAFMLKVNVWVSSENRHKSNEVIFSRPDTSAVFAYYKEGPRTHLVLVKEFRSPANNTEGFVYELPCGSTFSKGKSVLQVAQQELHEETGLLISEASRFALVSQRQYVATLTTHRATLLAVELSGTEFRQLQQTAARQQPLGVSDDSEHTYVVLTTLDDVFGLSVDYSTLGMIAEASRALKLTH